MITQELKYLTWEEAFVCLTNENLSDDIRAIYCSLITGTTSANFHISSILAFKIISSFLSFIYLHVIDLFIDVENAHLDLENIKLTFVYEQIMGAQKDEEQVLSLCWT